MRIATKATMDKINLNLEVISVHQVYISYLTVATKICLCLEPKKFMTTHENFTTPSSMPNYGLSNESKMKLGSFMSSI
jgi:hypothetical protein